jgi:hypothetical protein
LCCLFACALALTACGKDDGTGNNDNNGDGDADVQADAGDDVAEDIEDDGTDDADDADDGDADDGATDADDDATDADDDATDADDDATDADDDVVDADGDAGPECGDGVVEGDEICDGDELDGQTCSDEGFAGGALACNDTCDGYDTSGCNDCGNDMVDSGEECDGTALDGETCTSQGFDEGTLLCASDCTFDTSQCTTATCGNTNIEANEECDGTNLDGETCSSRGFVDGTLACNNCQFDESGCNTCGDDTINGSDVCDGSDLGGETCSSRGFVSGTLACTATCDGYDTSGCTMCGNDTVDSGETCDGTDLNGETCQSQGFDGGTLACGASCGSFDTSGCTSNPAPGAADLIITEVMQNPDALNDSDGEYFEVLNPSGTDTYNLNGCQITGKAGESPLDITTDVMVMPGQFLTIAISSSPGFTPDYVETGLSLANGSDRVAIECPGSSGSIVVDEVSWDDGANFPDPTGASMNLTDDPTATDATENDNGYWWCATPTNDLGNGDFGTPGAANEVCPTTAIEYCRLQFPTNATEPENTQLTFYGRLFIAGITDQSTSNETRQFFEVEMGYGPDGTDPSTNSMWVWNEAAPNGAYMGSGGSTDEDEYQSTITTPAASGSPYDTAFRFSGDYGRTWQYCDTVDGGVGFTYDISEAGSLTTTPATTTINAYFSEYIEGSSNNKALEIYNPDMSNAVDLTSCTLNRYSNGSNSPSPITFSPGATIPAGGVYTICNSSIDSTYRPLCDDTSGGISFNGDDALELVCNGATLDVFGQIGVDPGSEWSGGGVGTANQTLGRKCSVTSGDTDGSDAFDPSVEWNQSSQDDFSDFGGYTCP